MISFWVSFGKHSVLAKVEASTGTELFPTLIHQNDAGALVAQQGKLICSDDKLTNKKKSLAKFF